MTERIASYTGPPLEMKALNRLDRTARNVVLSILEKLSLGRVHLTDGDEEYRFGKRNPAFPRTVRVTVHHPRFYSLLVARGSIGAGEAYMAGYWSVDDLTALIRIMIRNRNVMAGIESRWSLLGSLIFKLFHLFRRETKKGSRKNIRAHYDLGNDFYALFLDETLTYSCGIFETEESSLKEASISKYDRICQKLMLTSSDHVLEIGTGWGGFAIHAAKTYGSRITTTTISPSQYELAKERIEEAGVSDRITLLLEDYRDLRGRYDKAVSIEMIEAVGHHYFDRFFKAVSDLLVADGMVLLQAITIVDQEFDRHKREVDFIKRYIFPGSCIPSVTAIAKAVARKTDLRIFHLEDITVHYAKTLRHWRERFFENIQEVRRMGYFESFIRMWEYYLCYCEAGFSERYLGDVQMLLVKPNWRSALL